MEPHWDGGMKVCSWGLGHMTKMATTPIYGQVQIRCDFLVQKWPLWNESSHAFFSSIYIIFPWKYDILYENKGIVETIGSIKENVEKNADLLVSFSW